MDDQLVASRQQAAEREFWAYDFDGKVIEGTSRWEGSAAGVQWDRRFYFESDVSGFDDDIAGTDYDDPACMGGCFVVVFGPGTDDVVEVRATHGGVLIGRRLSEAGCPSTVDGSELISPRNMMGF